MFDLKNIRIGIIGLGYVGLPLAIEFGKVKKTIGFDINELRINELTNFFDSTNEVEEKDFKEAQMLSFTSNFEDLKECNFFIVSVPTPIDHSNMPDLESLFQASEALGRILKKNDIVVYESTVYPGVTDDLCAPILEKQSNLVFNSDFYCGYSPERINPGDKEHKLSNIVKITSGSSPDSAEFIDQVYNLVVTAGTHKVSSIKVAEAAKVIENTQRDINIALINELAIIFNKLDIDTKEILDAASTKWNFIDLKPGLVGGHCIGVDPYYLAYKCQQVGYYPELILSGRRVNSNMPNFVVNEVLKCMLKKKIQVIDSKILIMGLAFKENCRDIRNTKVADMVNHFRDLGCIVDVYDPMVDCKEASKILNVNLIQDIKINYYSAIVLAVAHDAFKPIKAEQLRSFGKRSCVIYDLKHLLPIGDSDARL